jgi:DNA-binding beta-propeller fold protein YncE
VARDTETEPSAVEGETPPLIAFRELVYDEGQRLYELAVLLLEDSAVAMQSVLQSLDRVWTSLQRRQLYMDADESAFWGVVRDAARRRGRSTEVRGFQPPTTGSDTHVTAVGVVNGFSPEQAAALYQVARLGSSYQFAGVISGLGEPRARDVLYAARQEFREAREPFEPISAECSRLGPLISARVDGELRAAEAEQLDMHAATCPVCQATTRHFEEFNRAIRELRLPVPAVDVVEESLAIPAGRPDRRPTGWRRLLSLLAGPWGLIPFFIIGALILRQCSPAPVDVGSGRTSDLVYARSTDGRNILVIESGSGRELPVTIPAGALAPSGNRVVADAVSCAGAGCRTEVAVVDTATGERRPVGTVPGKLHTMAVGANEQAFLTDEEAGWNRLVAVGLADGRIIGEITAPPGVERAFGLQPRLYVPSTGMLFTLAQLEGQRSAILRTNLAELKVEGQVPLEIDVRGASLAVSDAGNHLYVYLPAGPRVLDVDAASGRVVQSRELADGAPPGGAAAVVSADATMLAADSKRDRLYAALPTGGVAVLDLPSLDTAKRLNPDQRYRSVGVSSDGGSLYTLGLDNTYRVLEADSGKERLHRNQVHADAILQVNAGE